MVIFSVLNQKENRMKLVIFAVVLPFLIFGCDNGRNLAELCKENQEICLEFGQDSWCKSERINVALARIDLKENQEDLQRFNLLVAYEGYIKCMGLASQIQHIKLKEKTTLRINNLENAKAKLSKLTQQTSNSSHPHLLYYHWTRYINEEALAKFLEQEGSSALENPQSQFNLATYYTKREPKKTLALLYRALELYKSDEKINPEIFLSISTVFIEKQQAKQVYIWLRILRLYSPETKEVTEKSLNSYIVGYKLNKELLDKVAVTTLDKIEAGTFKSPKI